MNTTKLFKIINILKRKFSILHELREKNLNRKIITRTKNILDGQFNLERELGSGKDGVTYLAKKNDNEKYYVLKILTRYAKEYLPMTKYLNLLEIHKNTLNVYKLNFLGDDCYYYNYEKLHEPSTTPEDFLTHLMKICDIEETFIKKGVVWWDFGFDKHSNYLLDENDNLKIIDYGGNGFGFVGDSRPSINIKSERRNLVNPPQEFIKAQLLLHVLYRGLGKTTHEPLASIAQNASSKDLESIIQYCLQDIDGTAFSHVAKGIVKTNLADSKGWKNLREVIEQSLEVDNIKIQESADIDSIEILDNGVRVRGYQSFEIVNKRLSPINTVDKKLWNTDKKFRIVKKALDKVTEKEKIESFLDIGSNLGLYVYLAGIEYKILKAVGYDYNQHYIKVANKIKNVLNLDFCTFQTKSFQEINEKFDCVLAMAIIHHLYHRTESYGSLDDIVAKFSAITNKVAIIEFPTEIDTKASKWTKMPGRKMVESYSQSNFLKAVDKHFSSYEEIDSIGKTRVTYLLYK